ncbi:outer membrane protein assembly factor BamE [Acetobacter estunensis]|uniref:Outer membrane protein assembly factor BamE n=1 Tax=Acetobacter estunensis TaxID=104097 RepID=A0A967B4X4_9PROT|nr:outer membrane protein assembly factor BamE [Acetobacter estunensis]NHO52489.1 outer membrane protein assembly factor BamE [Acetobacter estunensis]
MLTRPLPASTASFAHNGHGGRRLRKAVGLIGCVLALSGCAVFENPPMPRGSLIEADDYNQLQPGKSNRADAIDLLGSPTAKATFDDNTWIYISMMTAPTPANFPHVTKQQVVVLNFDEGGTLRALRTLNLKDAKHPGMVGDRTPAPGTKINILQEILGNVGRYNPMQGMMNNNSNSFSGAGGMMGNNGPGHGGAGNSLP